jgi:hypothetical protein
MRIVRRQNRLAVFIAIVALLGSMVGSVFAPTKASRVVDDILGSIVICTSHGAEYLQQDGGGSAPQSPSSHCPLCTLLAAFTFVCVVSLLAFALELPRVARLVSASGRTLADHICLGGIRSRAPPVAA